MLLQDLLERGLPTTDIVRRTFRYVWQQEQQLGNVLDAKALASIERIKRRLAELEDDAKHKATDVTTVVRYEQSVVDFFTKLRANRHQSNGLPATGRR